jgi:hypothetical protein
MKYVKIILYCVLLFSCKKEEAENVDFPLNKETVDSSKESYTKDDNRNMDHDRLMALKRKAVNGDKSAIFSLFNYYTYGIGDHEKAFYWGYLHDKIDKSQNFSQLAEDNMKGVLSELDMKQYDSKNTGDEIPNVKE